MTEEIVNDLSITAEHRISDHYARRVRALQAPPMSYRLHPSTFDGMVRRLNAKIEFGERNPDLTRVEFVTLHCAHGSTRVYLGLDVEEDLVRAVEYTGEVR